MAKMQVLQPKCFELFRCSGADCEDTCCDGWGVVVDRETYEKYQDPRVAPISGTALSSLVQINPASSSAADYAKMRLIGTRCSALHEGWCSIQQTLGESYLSDMCSSFPRVLNLTGGVVERSLDLSCPEAARLALSSPDAMAFDERTEEERVHRPGSLSLVSDAPDVQVHEVRGITIRMIRERSRPLWQRIASLGFAIDELVRVQSKPATAILEDHLTGLRNGSFDEILSSQAVAPAIQLEAVLQLIIARLGAEYTTPRFLECYSEFMRGLGWTGETTLEELAARYHHASQQHFLPFIRSHEHLLENYLVNYIFRTLFPYGRRQPDLSVAIDSGRESVRSAYLLFAAHYAIIRTVLIGMAGLHQHTLKIEHAIRAVQSCAKVFQHSSSYSAIVLKILAQYAKDPAQGAIMLVMD